MVQKKKRKDVSLFAINNQRKKVNNVGLLLISSIYNYDRINLYLQKKALATNKCFLEIFSLQ
jgi:hypothetical protein